MALTAKQQALADFIPSRKGGRAGTPELRVTEELRPIARPVDTFYRLPEPQKSPLFEVADALGGLGKAVNRVMSKMGAQQDRQSERAARLAEKQNIENAEAQGKVDAILGTQAGAAGPMGSDQGAEAEAVRRGAIPAEASPFYMNAYKEGQGEVAGLKMKGDILDAYQQWDKRGVATSQETSAWLADQVRTKIGDQNDIGVLKGSVKHLQELQKDIFARQLKDRDDNLKNDAVNNVAAGVGQYLDNGIKRTPDGSLDVAATAAGIEDLTKGLRTNGGDPAKINETIVNEVVRKATQELDPDLLQVLEQKRADGTPGAGMTAYGREKLAKARDDILDRANRINDLSHKNKERREKADSETAHREVAKLLAKDPTAEIPKDIAALGTAANPKFLEETERLRDAFTKGADRVDPKKETEALNRVYESPNHQQALIDEARAGNISAGTFRGKIDDAFRNDKRGANSETASPLLKSDLYKAYDKQFAQQLAGPDKDNSDNFQQYTSAKNDFDRQLLEWDALNPKATLLDRQKATKDIGDAMLGAIRDTTREESKAGVKADRQYVPPTVQAPEAAKAAPAPTAQPAAPAAQPQPQVAPPAATPQVRPAGEQKAAVEAGTVDAEALVNERIQKISSTKAFKPGRTYAEKAPQVMDRLMEDFKITRDQAAGIVGNLGHESGGFASLQEKKPTVAGSRGGWGWAQWTGPRRRDFEKWASMMKLDPTSDEANYGFLKLELSTTYRNAIAAVRGAKDAREAMLAFEETYEKAGKKHYDSRQRYAEEALNSHGSRT